MTRRRNRSGCTLSLACLLDQVGVIHTWSSVGVVKGFDEDGEGVDVADEDGKLVLQHPRPLPHDALLGLAQPERPGTRLWIDTPRQRYEELIGPWCRVFGLHDVGNGKTEDGNVRARHVGDGNGDEHDPDRRNTGTTVGDVGKTRHRGRKRGHGRVRSSGSWTGSSPTEGR